MGRCLALAVFALLALSSSAAAQPEPEVLDDEPSPFHVDLSLSWGQASVGFVSPSDVVPLCPEGETCDVPDFELDMLRGGIGLGYAGLTLEASLAAPLEGRDDPHVVGFAGVRLDTAWDGVLSVFFRLGYLRRWGTAEGEGGRGGIGINVRPTQALAFFGEASAEVSSVPSQMNDSGTLFSYATHLELGARLSFGH